MIPDRTCRTPAALALLTVACVVAHAAPAAAAEEEHKPFLIEERLGVRLLPAAFVEGVAEDGPAAAAGIGSCDLVTRVEDRDFRSLGGLTPFVTWLQSKTRSSAVFLEVYKWIEPNEGLNRRREETRVLPDRDGRIGADLVFQVMIESLDADGPARAAGVEAGEFLHAIGDEEMSGPKARDVSDLDRMFRAGIRGDGTVRLTLARWHPIADSGRRRAGFTTREVVVQLSPTGGKPAP